jgi:hypothetical protein
LTVVRPHPDDAPPGNGKVSVAATDVLPGGAARASPDNIAFAEYLLKAMRVGHVRLQLLQLELDSIGVALRHNMITPACAVQWMDDIGVLGFIDNPEQMAAT